MADKKIVTFANRSSVKVSEWKVEPGQAIYHGRVLFLYEDDTVGKLSKLKSKCVGTVINLLVKNGEVLNPGDPMLEIEEEREPVTQSEGLEHSNASMPLLLETTPPPIKINQQETELGLNANTERLLRDRKLVLLVDLDQTLVHTTRDKININIKDVHNFQLDSSSNYHTRLRPNVSHFLKEMSQLFELHICTFGVRPYANMVASILDKDKTLFGSRILSREDCFSCNSKVTNLQALFPEGDELVCIIDDRKDVWNNSPNLISVKPYMFFSNAGDMNGVNLPAVNSPTNFLANGVKLKRLEGSVIVLCEDVNHKETAEGENSEEFDVEDEDDYLLYLETILKEVHQLFYKVYDKKVEGPPHIRWVLEKLRGNVLKGCEIIFNDLLPLQEDLENSEPYLIATDLGAKVRKSISSTTTHVIAARSGSSKLFEPKIYPKIKVVNPRWLTSCLYRWEKVDERLFPPAKFKNKKYHASVPMPMPSLLDNVISTQPDLQVEEKIESINSNKVKNKSENGQFKEQSVLKNNSAVSNEKDKSDLKNSDEAMDIENELSVEEGPSSIKKSKKLLEAVKEFSDEPGPSRNGNSKELTDESNKSNATSNKELINIDKILSSFASTKLKAKPIKLDFLENNTSESLKKFIIPKKARTKARLSEENENKKEEKQSPTCSKNKKRKLKKKLQKQQSNKVHNIQALDQKEYSLRIGNFCEELKHLRERHTLIMQNCMEEHQLKINNWLSEHSIRMHYMNVEHETKLANLNKEHQAAMEQILGKVDQVLTNSISNDQDSFTDESEQIY